MNGRTVRMANDSLSYSGWTAWEFERNFDPRWGRATISAHQNTVYLVCASYIILLAIGTRVMKDNARYTVRPALILWNLVLAIFSIVGAVRTIPYVKRMLMEKGLKQSLCEDNIYSDPIAGFWAFAFAVSKVPELVDTLFIVIRKQKLIFLHWYHHTTVLLLCFNNYPTFLPVGAYYMTLNLTVHAMMYTYYGLRAAQVKIPKFVNMLITTAQIVQMIIGLYITSVSYSLSQDPSCTLKPVMGLEEHYKALLFAMIVYMSYFVLFAHFFYETYIRPTKRDDGKKAD